MKEDNGGYNKLIDTRELKCWFKNEVVVDKTYPILKSRQVLGRNISQSAVIELLHKKRLTWDKNIDTYEEIIKISSEVSIVHSVTKSPCAFFKARDFVEKRIEFKSQGATYIYCSSVPDYVYPQEDQYCRCTTIFSGTVLCEENEELVLYCISQTDLKTGSLAQSFAMPFLKTAVKRFNEGLLRELTSY